jgi:hypothetical protein
MSRLRPILFSISICLLTPLSGKRWKPGSTRACRARHIEGTDERELWPCALPSGTLLKIIFLRVRVVRAVDTNRTAEYSTPDWSYRGKT